jgi:hypothetical protein
MTRAISSKYAAAEEDNRMLTDACKRQKIEIAALEAEKRQLLDHIADLQKKQDSMSVPTPSDIERAAGSFTRWQHACIVLGDAMCKVDDLYDGGDSDALESISSAYRVASSRRDECITKLSSLFTGK